MTERYNSISLALGVPGIILQIVGYAIAQDNQQAGVAVLSPLASLAGTALLIAGLAYYAIAKGRSG